MKVKGLRDTIDWYDEYAGKYADSTGKIISSALLENFSLYCRKRLAY